jgi:DNA-binding MarR family transcriptional regulator
VIELSGFEADARSAVRALTRSSRILERSLQGLSLADFRVLSAVAEGEARASRLAQRLALGKPAISSTVESLVRRGLLRRESHHADQRATDLMLTDAGSAARSAAESELVAVVSSLVADTPDPGGTLAALAALDVAVERRQVALASARRAATGARPGSAAQVAASTPRAIPTAASAPVPRPADTSAPSPEAAGDAASDPVRLNAEFGGKVML